MNIIDLLQVEPRRVFRDGLLFHEWPDGTLRRAISGGSGDDNPPAEPPKPEPKPEFRPINSQDEFDAAISSRLARERAKFPSDDELKKLREAAKRLDEIEQENQTELQREQTLRAETETERDSLRAENLQLKNHKAIADAAAGQVQDLGAAVTLILANPETYAVTLDDAGQVTNAESAVKTLLEKAPYLATDGKPAGGGTVRTTPQGRGRGNETPTGERASARSADIEAERNNKSN